jgi:hypothetical protein
MWVGSADRWPARNEFVDERIKAHALGIQIAFPTNNQFTHRRRVATERVIVYKVWNRFVPRRCSRTVPFCKVSQMLSMNVLTSCIST